MATVGYCQAPASDTNPIVVISRYELTVKKAAKLHKQKIAKINADYLTEINKLRDGAATKLEELQKASALDDIDEAIRIRNMAKELEARELTPPNMKSTTSSESDSSVAKIPPTAVEWEGHHYQFFDQPMTWHTARKHCESLGGYLARVESESENAFVFDLAKKHTFRFIHIDGNDEEKEGVWVFSNGDEMKYQNWVKDLGKPDGFGRSAGLLVRPGDSDRKSQWGSFTLAYRIPFVCEWDE